MKLANDQQQGAATRSKSDCDETALEKAGSVNDMGYNRLQILSSGEEE